MSKKKKRDKLEPTNPLSKLDLPDDEYALLLKWSNEDDITLRSVVRQMIKHSEFIRSVQNDPEAKILVEKNGEFEAIRFI